MVVLHELTVLKALTVAFWAKMIFADVTGLIARAGEVSGQAVRWRNRIRNPFIGHNAMVIGVAAVHDRRAGWHADGAVAIRLVEANATVAQPVEVWGPNLIIASGLNGICALLVGCDHDNIGLAHMMSLSLLQGGVLEQAA